MNATFSSLRGTFDQAHASARLSGRPVISEWLSLSNKSPREGLRILADAFNYPVLSTSELLASTPYFTSLPLSLALQRQCVMLSTNNKHFAVLSDPFNLDLMNWLENRMPQDMVLALADEGDIRALLSKAESQTSAVDTNLTAISSEPDVDIRGEEISLVGIAGDSSPIVRLVNSNLYDALKAGASDIHFESTPAGLSVKYRVDGVLDEVTSAQGVEIATQAISRIKVLAELDIAERRIPQDGRFRISVGGRTTDLRVSVMPSIHGEDAVLRILDKRQLIQTQGKLTLDVLGFDNVSLRSVRRLACEPYGMLLVTGPTGSGKTTTLYAAISETLSGKDKTITIEDPVEYELPGVLQIPVNERKGLTFARGLRSILRHDPDRIMVGEIRDAETAEIAVQSALTGHLVLSTVHANSVFDVFSRFTHMGIDPHSLTSALNGIWAQRLVRVVCKNCAQVAIATDAEVEQLQLSPEMLKNAHLLRGRGCGDCRATGFKGRRAIAEVLIMNDALRELIVNRAPVRTIKDEARRGGTHLLRESALDLALQGVTTLDEVLRVTQHG